MSFSELFLIAIGLSMDAFAVAICTGLTMTRATFKKSLTVGAYFGVFQGAMPLIGYLLATKFADSITAFDHWIAFALLSIIGGRMLLESFKKEEAGGASESGEICAEALLGPAEMLPLAVATSIDALAVGVSFAFLKVSILQAVFYIGITTFLLSASGVKIGSVFGAKFKSWAETAGGIILILMGFKILFEHIGGNVTAIL